MLNPYKMELWEKDYENYMEVQRVPGGWICTPFINHSKLPSVQFHQVGSSVFVPYNNEFDRPDFDVKAPEFESLTEGGS